MNAYIKTLKDEGYTSLRDEYYDSFNSFPVLGKKDSNKPLDPDTVDIEDQTANKDDDGENEEAEVSEESIPGETTPEEEITLRELSKDTSQIPPDQTLLSPNKQTPEANQVEGPQLGNEQPEELPTGTKEKAPILQVK